MIRKGSTLLHVCLHLSRLRYGRGARMVGRWCVNCLVLLSVSAVSAAAHDLLLSRSLQHQASESAPEVLARK